MLLTTPTSLSFLEESSLRTNNSFSHIILLSLIIITLFLLITLSLLYPSSSSIVTVQSLLLCPNSPSIHFISLQSMLYWFLQGLSCHISISLNSHSHSISLHLAGLFPFSRRGTHKQSLIFPICSFQPGTRCLSLPDMITLNLFFCFAINLL